MKLYRAIEFSKLSFMLSDYGIEEWNNTIEEFKQDETKKTNWWFSEKHQDKIEFIIADIISNGQQAFFQKSLTYNSVVGGRYNPPNSFGVLYSANNPALAALEVLYHIYDSKKKYLNDMAKSSENYSATFDEVSPQLAKNLIVIFELDINDANFNIQPCITTKKVQELISKVGFSRYTEHEDFNENFIFGNTYEISRILGCYLNTTQENTAYRFKSARLENTMENSNSNNVIFPEKFVNDHDFKLTRNYYLVESSMNIQEFNGMHEIDLVIRGENEINAKVFLEKYLNENKVRNNPDRLIEYRPILPEDLQPHLNTRKVLFQRFKNYSKKLE